MEDQAVIDLLTNTSNQLNSIMTGPGAMIQFSSASGSMNPLKDALIDVLNKFLDKQVKINDANNKKKHDRENKEADERAKEQIEAHKKIIQGIIDKKTEKDKSHIGTLSGLAQHALTEMRNNNKSTLSFTEKFLGYSARTIEIGKDLVDVTTKIYKIVSLQLFQNVHYLTALRESGVLIKEGFDKGFTKYVQMSGQSREELLKIAQENSRAVSSMNASGINGMEMLSKESKKLTGILGLSTKEIDASLKYHNDSLLTAANQADIATMDHESVLVKSTKALKMFSYETGQSYENLLKERKEREKTWQMQRLANDPKTKAQFTMLRNLGMSDEQIEAIMLGKANKASVMAQLDPESAAIFNSLQKAYRNSKGNPEMFSRELARISNSGAANSLRRRSANLNMEDMAYLGENMGVIMDPSLMWGKLVNERLNEKGESYLNDKDSKAISDYRKIQAEKERIKEKIRDSMSLSIDKISKVLPKIAKAAEWLNNFLDKHPGFATVAGILGIGSMFASAFANSLLPILLLGGSFKKLGKFMGLGLIASSGKKLAKLFTGIWKKGASVLGAAIKGSLKTGAKGATKSIAKAGAKAGAKAASKAVSKAVTKNAAKAGAKAGAKAVGKAAEKAIGKTVGKTVAKTAGKSAVKKIPLIGLGAGLIFGAMRAWDGDWEGAGLEIASGAASTVPIVGTAASFGIDAGLAARDIGNAMNEPANADETSEYNADVEQEDAEENAIVNTPEGICQCVSVENISLVEELLHSINENTKALVNELRNNGFNVGTNLAG